ncbi:MAG: hypothetical protein ABW133_01195 [Polyangiaceae bacterium]
MDRMVRCTVCCWRGTLLGAIIAPRVRQSDLPPAELAIQEAYEEERRARRAIGHPTNPLCPACGHHTVAVERRSVRPAA